MDVSAIFLYCLYACLQMYILMFVGLLSVWKKVLDEKRSAVFSKVVFALIIPLFQIVQISSAGTYNVLALLWIIIVNFLLAMLVAYIITAIFHKILKLEYRVKNSFAGMCTFPAIGALPLVIGNGYCFPGGPVEHDPFCKDFLGVMILSVMVLNYALFVVGYLLLKFDKAKNEEITVKMSYIWHDVIGKIYNKKNQTIKDLFENYIKDNEKAGQLYEKFEEENKLPEQNEENEANAEAYMNYYDNAFKVIEENLNEEVSEVYQHMKTDIICNLEKKPPVFPISIKINIDDSQAVTILNDYAEWEKNAKTKQPSFSLVLKTESVSLHIILKSLLSPPTTAFFLGMTLAMSKIRDLMYNGNIYWTNIIDGFKLIISNLTPFLFLVIGVACLPKKDKAKKKKHLLINKVHIIFIFIIRFIIIPFIGMAVILFWKKVYGHECATSPVFRLVLFFPWCLPSSTTFSVLVTMADYFFEEYGLLVLLQNFSCIITLTLLNLIYFILVGLDEDKVL